MHSQIQQILLEAYDFNKRKKFAIEYSWKAIFRIVPTSKDLPDLYFIATSSNYVKPKDLHVDLEQEVLDIKEVASVIESRFRDFLEGGSNLSQLSDYFVIDEQ